MIRRLAGAFQFLTIIPLPIRGALPADSIALFPVVGVVFGLAGAWMLQVLSGPLPATLVALLVVKLWSWLSGSLHEDGLADSADAFRAGRSPARIQSILKDSRIGTYGAVALVFSIVIRWQALVHLAVSPWTGLVAAQAVPRAAIVALAWIARPVGGGSAAMMSAGMTSLSAVVAILIGVVAALGCGLRLGVVVIAISAALVLLARRYYYWRLGGITGDCLGALAQINEIVLLILFTCRECMW